MPESKRVIEVSDFEHRLMVNCMRTARNEFIDEGAPTEDVSKLMVKVMNAPTKKEKRKADRAASRTRAQYLIPDQRQYWENGKKYLFNPIGDSHIFTQNRINYDTGLLYRSSYTALEDLSEKYAAKPDEYSYFACYDKSFSEVYNNQIPVFPTMTPKDTAFIETMVYDPSLLTNTDALDPVSLYAYFLDKDDKKALAELDRIIERKLKV